MVTEACAGNALLTGEDVLRARDRRRVNDARRARRPLLLLSLLAGPGILTMLGENDGPSMLSYATTGAMYGLGIFVPIVLLTFVMAFVVQEAATRIGIATGRGHAELIFSRFGAAWGRFSMANLAVGNLLTLATEFIAIRSGAAFFGIPPPVAVTVSAAVVAAALLTRRYFTWERFALLLAAGNLLFIPVALSAHVPVDAMHPFMWTPAGGATSTFVMLVLANVGATVTPWMIFFQQSAVVDKGLTPTDLRYARADTLIGATVAATVAVATIVIGSVLFAHRVAIDSFGGAADFAGALRPYLGSAMAHLFALGMIEAGLVAAVTISVSSSYAVGEAFHRPHSLNRPLLQAKAFYATALVSVACAAAFVLLPHMPLLEIALAVNVLATILMAPALLFVLLLANDRTIMGRLANGRVANVCGGTVMAAICVLSLLYAVLSIFPHLLKAR